MTMTTLKKNEMFNVPQGFSANQIAKMIAFKYGVDASDFTFDKLGNKLIYAPKKKAIIKKPKGMSVADYYNNIVLASNKKLAETEKKYINEEWKPVQNLGRYFEGKVDYSCLYEVSNMGRLRCIDVNNAMNCSISDGYDAPTRNAMQFHLNAKGINGETLNTCPDVKYMVADAFLEQQDPKKYIVVHIDGDYHNNKVSNLAWVERK